MSKKILQNHEDLVDFVQGCLLYGVGGGGNPKEGLKALEAQMADGNALGWVQPEDLPAGSWVACAFLMGSTAPLTPDKLQQMKELGLNEWTYPNNLVETTKFLEEYTGKHISALVPLEMGGSNTPLPVAVAGGLGGRWPWTESFSPDGQYRKSPKSTPVGCGISFTPATSVDKWGNKSIIVDTINIDMAERLGKLISDASFGSTGLCGFLIPAEDIKNIYVPNTMTEALKAGQVIRKAKAERRDVAELLCRELGFYHLFRGKVIEKPWEDRDGYYWGTHVLEGTGPFAGETGKVVFKNENQLFYVGDQLRVSSPDLIINIDNNLGEGRRNDDIKLGDDLTILGCPCKAALRTPIMLSTLEPKHFGVDAPYVPIEDAMKK